MYVSGYEFLQEFGLGARRVWADVMRASARREGDHEPPGRKPGSRGKVARSIHLHPESSDSSTTLERQAFARGNDRVQRVADREGEQKRRPQVQRPLRAQRA